MTPTTVERVVAGCTKLNVHYTLVDCNPLTPLLRFVLNFLYNLFLQFCAAISKISTDTLRRAVRLLQQSCCYHKQAEGLLKVAGSARQYPGHGTGQRHAYRPLTGDDIGLSNNAICNDPEPPSR